MGGERGGEVLDPETRQPVPVLDDDPSDLAVRKESGKARTLGVRARADLGHDLVEREAVLGCPQAHPTGLALEVVTLVVRAHPAVGDGPAAGEVRWLLLDNDRARGESARRHRHRAVTKPAVGGVRVDAVRTSPLGELHSHKRTHVR